MDFLLHFDSLLIPHMLAAFPVKTGDIRDSLSQ